MASSPDISRAIAALVVALVPTTALLLYNMWPSRIFGYAKTTFSYSTEGVLLRKKDGDSISLQAFCESITPPCRLNPLLFNGHLQTIWTAVKSFDVPIYYKRIIFDADEPEYTGTFAVDFVTRPYEGGDPTLPPRTSCYTKQEISNLASQDSKPMLVVLHGLSGGSFEVYLRHCLAPLVTPDEGWEACVVNSRGCAGSKITSSVLYNARATWDVRQTVKWLKQRFPNRPLYGLGFSLGANILANYLGEEGSNSDLKAAVLVSCPWSLEASALSLQRGLLSRHVYSRTMGTNMKKLFRTHMHQILKNPRINTDEVMQTRFLHEFDRHVQCATWGYPTENAYYRDASSCDSLLAIKTPFLAINATDDPIAVNQAIPFEEFKLSKFGVLCATSLGGHLSWFEIGGGRWFARVATQFFKQWHSDIGLEQLVVEHGGGAEKALSRHVFSPMRRKMHVLDE